MVEARNLIGGEGQEIRGLSFRLKNGEAYGFLGQQGEVSALLRMLSGSLTPLSGSILIGGMDLCREGRRAKRELGFVPSEPCLPDSLTALEALFRMAEIKGLSYERGIGRVTQLLESAGLSERADLPLSALSPLERRLTELLQALLTDPEILIFEDPARRWHRRQHCNRHQGAPIEECNTLLHPCCNQPGGSFEGGSRNTVSIGIYHQHLELLLLS